MFTALSLLSNSKIENPAQMKIIPVTEAEVKATIKTLKSKNSTGYDGISNSILKKCMHLISKPLTHICKNSLESGIFPERCKFAIVRLIYKKGDEKKISNYRPISLLLAISKIF